MTTPRTTRLRVARRIAADPTSTALLLAGPTALELWPGVRRVGDVGRRALVEAELALAPAPGELFPTSASVTAHPPQRTPTAFVTRFSWSGSELPEATGVLTLTYGPGGHGTPSTGAELLLDVQELEDSRLDAASLTAMAGAFLGNLARAAEQRRSAA